MKKYKKLSLFITFICTSLFFGKHSMASYIDEGIAFYAKNNSSGYVTEGIAFYANSTQTTNSLPVYRFYNTINGDHFYTISQTEANSVNSNPSGGYIPEDIAFYAEATPSTETSPVFRFYNTINGDHFYTASTGERDALINNPQWGYLNEGIIFYINMTQTNGTSPVYRFYNPSTGDHFYTASETEKNNISQSPVYRFYNTINGDHFYTAASSEKNIILNNSKNGYIFEGTAFYNPISQLPETSPVYRFYNQTNGDHFYTASETEKNALINNAQSGYIFEDIAFYAPASQSAGYYPIYRLYNTTTGDHFYTISLSEKVRAITPALGPDISVGLWNYSASSIKSSPFQIEANKTYNIRDNNGSIIAQIGGGTVTKVTYDDNGNLEVYNSITPTIVNSSVSFDAADGDNTNIVFNTHRSSFTSDWRGTINNYRGKIKVQYYRGPDVIGNNTSSTITQIWVINTLPLEQYTWGAAELYGTGDLDHSKVMVTAFRSFGFRRVQSSTLLYPNYGFRVLSNSSDQNYGGYDWETDTSHQNNIRKAAEETRGITVTYGGSTVVTPYNSWSAGSSRTYGSSRPWCVSVPDPYGNYNDSYWKNPDTKTQAQLIADHNAMYGLIAKGSQRLAAEYGWDWQRILKYYYTGIGLTTNY